MNQLHRCSDDDECKPPFAIIDASSDLPGPGASSLPRILHLSPGGAFVGDPSW